MGTLAAAAVDLPVVCFRFCVFSNPVSGMFKIVNKSDVF